MTADERPPDEQPAGPPHPSWRPDPAPAGRGQPAERRSPEGPGGGAPPEPPAPPPSGLDPKVAGLLAYLLGWIGGLIVLLIERQNREVRFHAAQSILLSIAIVVIGVGLNVVLGILRTIPFLGAVASLISLLTFPFLGLGAIALFVVLCVKGYRLEHYKLPVIGDLAESWAGTS